jgi:hypothetical protein
MKFRRQPISSTYIWERIRRANGGASRLRWRTILLLLLQIIAVLAGVIAAAQPRWLAHRQTGTGTLFLIDVSASMTATDLQPDRLAAACAIAEKEINRLPRGQYGAIFACSSDALLLGEPTADRSRLISFIKKVRANGTAFDEYEVSQSLQEWLSHQERPWQICLITDGGLSLNGKGLASLNGGRLRVIHVGIAAKNLGIAGLRLLDGQETMVTIDNSGSLPKNVRVALKRDGRRLAVVNLSVKQGINRYTIPWKYTGHPPTGLYQAVLLGNHDFLAMDDQYYLAVNPPRRYHVLLVGETNPFLQAILDNPQIDLEQVRDFPKNPTTSSWDLTIVNRVKIPESYHGNLLTFGVVPLGLPIRTGKELHGVLEGKESPHPLQRFINWQSPLVMAGRELVPTDVGIQTLATVQGRPIMLAFDRQGEHLVVCGTDLNASEIGLSGAFPVFIQNILEWCVPQGNNPLAYTLTSGRAMLFSEPSAWKLEETPADFSAIRQGHSIRLMGMSPGFARWRQGNRRGFFAVNIPMSEHFINLSEVYHGKPGAIIHGRRIVTRFGLTAAFLFLLFLSLLAEWIIWRGDWSFFRKE